MLESLAVRTMSKARYSTANLGHLDWLLIITAILLRLSEDIDVMAHRMLQHYLDGGSSLPEDDFRIPVQAQLRHGKLASEAGHPLNINKWNT
ncbi:MAG: hypothetical protein IPH28_23295 [Cytophagaceae bacterium]|nr:hypothetical protein [Cytophagaceae bacterium]